LGIFEIGSRNLFASLVARITGVLSSAQGFTPSYTNVPLHHQFLFFGTTSTCIHSIISLLEELPLNYMSSSAYCLALVLCSFPSKSPPDLSYTLSSPHPPIYFSFF
jgi:hypothetical protein